MTRIKFKLPYKRLKISAFNRCHFYKFNQQWWFCKKYEWLHNEQWWQHTDCYIMTKEKTIRQRVDNSILSLHRRQRLHLIIKIGIIISEKKFNIINWMYTLRWIKLDNLKCRTKTLGEISVHGHFNMVSSSQCAIQHII